MAPHILDFSMAAWSPTGCSPTNGCLLACITSRHSVFIYTPTTSHVDKQWMKYITLDKHLASYWGVDREVNLVTADQVENVSMAWSPKISVDNIGSVLALGNKTGHITIWHVKNPETVRCVRSCKTASDNWIVRLSWSPWTVEGDCHTSTLAYASADGTVQARKIKFNTKSPLENIEISEDLMGYNQTPHPCTVLRWRPIDAGNVHEPNILAFSKGNRIHVWIPTLNETRMWRRPIAKAIADITWDTFGKSLFVFFMDGKHNVLRLENDGLVVDEEYAEFVHQTIISRCHMQTKTNITQDEGEQDSTNAEDEGGDDEASGGVGNNKLQLHVTAGDSSAAILQLATVYHVTSPYHMEFQRERFQSCTMVLSKAYRSFQKDLGQALLKRLETFIRLPNSVLTRNPAYHLWDILLVLVESPQASIEDPRFEQGLLGVLEGSFSISQDDILTLAQRETLSDNNTALEPRLEKAIFSETNITADRLGTYLWSHLKDSRTSTLFKTLLKHRSEDAEGRIQRYCILAILKLFNEASAAMQPGDGMDLQLKDCDQTLLLLLCDSVLLFHHEDKELVSLAEKTYHVLHDLLQGMCDITEQLSMLQDIKNGVVPTPRFFSSGRETCPACDSKVKLETKDRATCTNGHSWQRCSVTLMLIADFHPRTCLGCRRKTLMVPSTAEGTPAIPGSTSSSWLEIILRANSVCCFCGERYFTALRRRGT